MKHLGFEVLNKNVLVWFKENFVKTMLPYDVRKDNFNSKYVRILKMPKVWRENDYWLVEAHIEYTLKQSETVTITFQVNDVGKITGYKIHEECT